MGGGGGSSRVESRGLSRSGWTHSAPKEGALGGKPESV